MSDFKLLDIIGGSRVYDYNSKYQVIGYDAGPILIIWDIITDKKHILNSHDTDISAIKFTKSHKGKFLVSSSSGLAPSLCLWEWQSSKIMHHTYLPLKQRSQPVQECLLNFIDPMMGGTPLLLVIENEEDGHRLTVWDYSGKSLQLLFIQQLDVSELCCGIFGVGEDVLSSRMRLLGKMKGIVAEKSWWGQNNENEDPKIYGCLFVSTEINAIKYWGILKDYSKITLIKKITLQNDVKKATFSDLNNILIILTNDGSIIFIDNEGKYISSIKNHKHQYTCLVTENDLLFLGCDEGSVEIYKISSLTFKKEIPFQYSFRTQYNIEKNVLRSSVVSSTKSSTAKLLKTTSPSKAISYDLIHKGPRVVYLLPSANAEILTICHNDSSIFIINLEKDEITNFTYGHHQKISDIQWMNTGNLTSFITSSYDLSLSIWKHWGDRWTFSFIDIPNILHPSLTYYRSQALQQFKISSICVHPKLPYVITGCNKGSLRIFHLKTGKLVTQREISNIKISKITANSEGDLLFVMFYNGLCNVYDIEQSLSYKLTLENGSGSSLAGAQQKGTYYSVEVIPPPNPHKLNATPTSVNLLRNSRLLQLDSLGTSIQEGTSFYNRENVETKVVCSKNLRTLRVHNIYRESRDEIKEEKLLTYSIYEWRINGFGIHPSNEYLGVISDGGFFYLFRIDSGEIRGRIQIPSSCMGISIDPSGLYFATSAPSQTEQPVPEEGLEFKVDMNKSVYTSITNENRTPRERRPPSKQIHRRKLLLYEIGTGDFSSEIINLFPISNFKFSYDGRHLFIGSNKGIASIWALGDKIKENIFKVLDNIKMNPEFWENFPIFLYVHPKKELDEEEAYEELEKEREDEYQYVETDPIKILNQTKYTAPQRILSQIESQNRFRPMEEYTPAKCQFTTPTQDAIVQSSNFQSKYVHDQQILQQKEEEDPYFEDTADFDKRVDSAKLGIRESLGPEMYSFGNEQANRFATSGRTSSTKIEDPPSRFTTTKVEMPSYPISFTKLRETPSTLSKKFERPIKFTADQPQPQMKKMASRKDIHTPNFDPNLGMGVRSGIVQPKIPTFFHDTQKARAAETTEKVRNINLKMAQARTIQPSVGSSHENILYKSQTNPVAINYPSHPESIEQMKNYEGTFDHYGEGRLYHSSSQESQPIKRNSVSSQNPLKILYKTEEEAIAELLDRPIQLAPRIKKNYLPTGTEITGHAHIHNKISPPKSLHQKQQISQEEKKRNQIEREENKQQINITNNPYYYINNKGRFPDPDDIDQEIETVPIPSKKSERSNKISYSPKSIPLQIKLIPNRYDDFSPSRESSDFEIVERTYDDLNKFDMKLQEQSKEFY